MKLQNLFIGAILATSIVSCGSGIETAEKEVKSTQSDAFPDDIKVDRFADIQMLRYEIKDFDKLSIDQKKLVYYMAQAGLAGRDIIYDQNSEHNLEIRKAMETIVGSYKGDKENDNWKNVLTYAKQVWFANVSVWQTWDRSKGEGRGGRKGSVCVRRFSIYSYFS